MPDHLSGQCVVVRFADRPPFLGTDGIVRLVTDLCSVVKHVAALHFEGSDEARCYIRAWLENDDSPEQLADSILRILQQHGVAGEVEGA
jgi:hypothetical protein